MLAASVWPKMPKTPHSSLNLSMTFSGRRRPALGDPFREIPLDRRRPHAFRFGKREIDRRLAADRDPDPVAADTPDHPHGDARLLGTFQYLRDAPGRNRHDGARRRLAEERGREIDRFEAADVLRIDRGVCAYASILEAAFRNRH